MSNLKVRILHIAHCSLLIAHSTLAGSWPQCAVNKPWRLPMSRLVTGNLSLVTGDWQKLIPSVTLFSISSDQLPVTSYQSKRFMAAEQVRKGQGALPAIEGEPSPNSDQRTEVLCGYFVMGGRAGSTQLCSNRAVSLRCLNERANHDYERTRANTNAEPEP